MRAELPDDQQRLLQAVFDRFHRTGQWPELNVLRFELDQADDDLDVPKVARQLPAGLASIPLGEGRVGLTIHGVAACRGSSEELDDLVLVTRYAYRRYGEGGGSADISSGELATDLDMSELRIARIRQLLMGIPWDGGGGGNGEWHRLVHPDIIRFRRVETAEDLLAQIPPPGLTAGSNRNTSDSTPPGQDPARPSDFPFDVALSFAGEQRAYVEQVAETLRSVGRSVFYDKYEAVSLWGKNLYDHFADVYQNQAKYVVMFISADYAAKAWTNHERQSAQARALREERAYILPVRFDKTEIPGLLSTVDYIDISEMPPADLSTLILKKLALPEEAPARREPKAAQPVTVAKEPAGLTRPEAHLDAPAPDVVSSPDSSPWSLRHRPIALQGLAELGIADYFEVTAAVFPVVSGRSQRALMEAVEQSQIDTFGWPIGVVIQRDTFAPKPIADGVVARLSINDDGSVYGRPRKSFDYWALSGRGDFYLLKNMCEDDLGRPDALFFNTRVIRVAETVMFLTNLYATLGLQQGARVRLTVRHVGLDHRELSSVGNRHFFRIRHSIEPEIASTVDFSLEDAKSDPTPYVKSLLASLFSVYEFFELSDDVYKDIVSKFRAGDVS